LAIMRRKIIVKKKMDEDNWHSTGTELVDATGFSLNTSMGKIIDNFSFKVLNSSNKYFFTKTTADGTDTVTPTLSGESLYMPPLTTTDDPRVIVYVDDVLKTQGTHYNIPNPYTSIVFTSGNEPSNGAIVKVKFNVIEPDDLVEIYIWKDAASEILVMDGTVSNAQLSTTPDGSYINVRGKSWIETLFNSMASVDGYGYTAPQVIGGAYYNPKTSTDDGSGRAGIVDQQQLYNANRKIYWHPDNVKTGYSTINFIEFYQPAIDMLDKASAADLAGTQHIYYIKRGDAAVTASEVTGEYYLVWETKSGTVINTITIPTTICNSVKFGAPADDVINVVLYNAGKDCYGHSVHYIVYDDTSLSSLGAKWKYVMLPEVAQEIIEKEFSNSNAKWAKDADGNRTESFPNNYSGYTMAFKDRDANGVVTANNITPANDSQFNAAVRKEAKWSGQDSARDYLNQFNSPLEKLSLLMPRVAADTYIRGSLVTFVYNDVNHNSDIRIKSILHDFWKTELQLEQDPEDKTPKPGQPDQE